MHFYFQFNYQVLLYEENNFVQFWMAFWNDSISQPYICMYKFSFLPAKLILYLIEINVFRYEYIWHEQQNKCHIKFEK